MDLAFASSDEIESLQVEALRAHVAYCAEFSPYYRGVLHGVLEMAGTSSLAELLARLPLTAKEDIARRNDDFRAVSLQEIIDVSLSSGTTGEMTRMMYTERDLRRLAYNEEKSLLACGLSARDVVLSTCTMDRCFVAGLAYFLGLRAIGAASVRNGNASLESHIGMIALVKPTAMVGVPTFLRRLGRAVRDSGSDPAELGVRRIVCIGEALRERDFTLGEVGRELERTWRAQVYSTYASSEVATTFCECSAQRGGHLHPDLGVLEIVDGDGRTVGPGQIGEVVVTPLVVEGMPLIRFRTGDVSFRVEDPCSCGRRSVRLGPILGRRAQMLKIRGTTVYPDSVFAVLSAMPGVSEYDLSVWRDEGGDRLRVNVAVSNDAVTPEMIEEKLRARLRFRPEVVIEDEAVVRARVYVPESRKPVRFRDARPCGSTRESSRL